MKTQSVHITIPTPCHESWANMDATDKGAFCHSCRKEVIDFTVMTDREVVEYLQKHKTGCGRLRHDQLDHTLTIPQVHNGVFGWKALLLGLLPLLSARQLIAAPASTVRTDQSPIKSTPKLDTVAAPSCGHDIEICGRIVDEKDEGLFGAAVQLIDSSGRSTGIGAAADIDGNFSIPLDSGNFKNGFCDIKISFLGYQTQIIKGFTPGNRFIRIEMKPVSVNYGMVGLMIYHKRTPVQKIKYWFRRTFHPHPKY
jgi:hypothetical protein